MTLGVSISCMPAFSHMLRHNLPQFKSLQSRLYSRFNRSRYQSEGSSAGKSSYKKAPSDYNGKSGAVYDGYGEVKMPRAGISGYEMEPVNPTQIYVGDGTDRQIEEDGVHLNYELRQESHHLDHDVQGRRQETTGSIPGDGKYAVEAEMV